MGTNGGSSWTRPGTAPARSDTALVTGYAYDTAGRMQDVTDPKGLVSRTTYDALGRVTKTVANYVDGVVSDADDQTTEYAYNGAGMTALTARLTGGGVQTTQWVYGVTTAGGSGVESNDAVGAVRWPDPSTGAASSGQQETVKVNALGQTAASTDRNGSVHTLSYDVLGRVTADAVTTLGSGVDGAVRRVETAYDGQGNAYLVTTYNAASSGSVVNQVKREYNGLGQLTADWQSHSGAVTGSSPKVGYAYSEMSGGANHSRPTSVTYPSGYALAANYAAGLPTAISRLSSLSDSTGTVEGYDYLGLGTVARRSHPQPGVDLTYVKMTGESNGDAGDQYTGLDRFGRVIDQRWVKTSGGTATDRFGYGYDRGSNRLYRDNLVNAAFGELYAYDGTGQVTSFSRGTLNGTKTGLTGAASRTQGWDYDAAGNWDSVTTDGTAQTRTANRQNEITAVGGATTPTYDANGNLTKDETGKQYAYDAWNRMVTVKSSGGTTLETLAYDGLGRRVSGTASGTTTDLYYDGWQVVEEKVGSNTQVRNVWSPAYVDALVMRDRDTDGNGTLDERLWVQTDANWNVTALVNGSGAVVERYAYDPFGTRTVYDGSYTVRSGGTSYAMAGGFQGLRQDSVSGLLEADRRWYSTTLGRWTSRDPIEYQGQDINLYRFVRNIPANYSDPTGLDGPLRGLIPPGTPLPWAKPENTRPIGGIYNCPVDTNQAGFTSHAQVDEVRRNMHQAADRIFMAHHALLCQWERIRRNHAVEETRMGDRVVRIPSTTFALIDANRQLYLRRMETVLRGLRDGHPRWIRVTVTNETHEERNPLYTQEWRALWIDWTQRTINIRTSYWENGDADRAFWMAHEYARFFLRLDNDSDYEDGHGVQEWDLILSYLNDHFVAGSPNAVTAD